MAFKLGGLYLEFQARKDQFDRALDEAEQRAKATADVLGDATDFEIGGKAKSGSGMKQAGMDAQALSSDLRAAFGSALLPLQSMGSNIIAMMDHVGGTVVTMARRIDDSMKLSATRAALDVVAKKLEDGLARGAGVARDQMTRLDRAIESTGKTALKAIGWFRGLENLKSFLGSIGDPAARSLSQLAGVDFSRTLGQTRTLSNNLGSVGRAANSSVAGVQRLGTAVLGALGVFGAAYEGVRFFKAAITGAAQLNETLNKTGVIFADSSSIITSEADRMAKKYGSVRNDFIAAASSFGAVGKGAMGKTQEDAAKLGVQLTKLAYDMASFEGPASSNAEAIAAVTSALQGEMEPIRRFRVFLNEDQIATQALTMGLIKNKNEMTDAAKKAAVVALIFKQTADAQGDLDRTLAGTTNQYRLLTGTLRNLTTSIGQQFMPVADKLVSIFASVAETVQGAFERNQPAIASFREFFVGAFETARMMVVRIKDALAGLPAAIEKAFPETTGWLTAWGQEFKTRVIDNVEALGSLMRGLPEYFQLAGLHVAVFVTNAGARFDAFKTNLGRIAEYIANNWKDMLIGAFTTVDTAIRNLGENLRRFGNALGKFLMNPAGGFEKVTFKPILDGLKVVFAALPEMAKPQLITLQKEIDDVWAKIKKADDDFKNRVKAQAQPAPVGAPAGGAKPPGAAAMADKGKDHGEHGLTDFAHDLLSKQLAGAKNIPQQQLDVLRRIDKNLQRRRQPQGGIIRQMPPRNVIRRFPPGQRRVPQPGADKGAQIEQKQDKQIDQLAAIQRAAEQLVKVQERGVPATFA